MLIYWQAAPSAGGLAVDGNQTEGTKMNGIRFYADLPGTWKQPERHDNRFTDDKPLLPLRTTVKQLKAYADNGGKLNVVALLLGNEHRCPDYSQEALTATFGHADSDTSLGSVSHEYLRDCRRIPEDLARRLHPRLFARLDADNG